MKFLGVLIIGFLLFSYLPLEAFGHCSEEEHSVDNRMGCGYLFHCPFTSDTNANALSVPFLNGWLIEIAKIERLEEPVIPIFHPPKKYLIDII